MLNCSTATLVAIGLLTVAVAPAFADDDQGDQSSSGQYKAVLSGPQVNPTNLSQGTGYASVTINQATASISVVISYSDLTGPATAAHLHLGKAWENGAVVVPICGTNGRVCPTQGAEATFTFPLTGADLVALPDQRFTADLPTLLRAISEGAIYVNVHTAAFPNGEIRGQLGRGNRRGMGRATGSNSGNGHGNGNGHGKGLQ